MFIRSSIYSPKRYKSNYTIEKELGIELVGDIKMKVEANDDEDPWDEIVEEKQVDEEIDKKIDEVNEEFLQENE